ncbi:MAG: tetratricopeptide repeat protein [Candidatus Aminicenantes bacterium]|nr:tetratricopeptide repeat protein [Candidatus Aminicenantes bacterium]
MVKKIELLCVLFLLTAACATIPPPPPTFYLESLPQSLTIAMTLEERILAEEAWDFIRQGRADKAGKTLSRLSPESPLYYVGFGYIAFLSEDLQSAEAYFQSAASEFPELTLARIGLAQVYERTGEEDKAFNELREILKLNPQHPWAREEYEAMKTKKTQEAVEEAKSALSEGNPGKGKEAYLRALHYSPEFVPAHAALAELYMKEKRLSNALVHLQAAHSIEPGNRKLLENYAATLEQAGQYEKSLEAYEKLFELDTSDKRIQDRIESIKNRLGIYEIPSRYTEIPLATAVTREEVAALVAVKLREVLAEPAPQPPIIVDISASWASRFILKVTALGLLDVYANHSYQPRKPVTRAEMADLVSRIIKHLEGRGYRFIRQIPMERIQVQDVTPEHVCYLPIIQVLSYQVMELFPDKSFRPDLTLAGHEAIRIMDILLALVR